MDWSPPPLQASKEWSPPALVAPADPPPKVEVRLSKLPAYGWHVHRCSRGHEWSHPDTSVGNVAEHTCPVCGERDWMPKERNTRIVETTKPVQTAKPVPRVLLPANP